MNSKLLAISTLLASFSLQAQYYQTLPKGVRTFVYRNITTNDVDSTYSQAGVRSSTNFEVKATAELLSQLDNPEIQTTLAQLAPYPEALNALSLGTYKGGGSANIKVDAYGFGYGITDKLTAYVGLPVYEAKVKVNYQRTEGNTYDKVAEVLQENVGDNISQGIGSNLHRSSDLVDFDESVLQSLFVNKLNYAPLGDWYGQGLGDMELGMMYNFFKKDDFGAATTFGVIAPTGREDDPDILQDIGFGDGQWDLFSEIGFGYRINSSFSLNSYLRYTHQFEREKELRRPSTKDFKYSAEKGNFTEKLGNKILYSLSSDYSLNDWLTFTAGYDYENTGKANYKSIYGIENDYLAYGTNSESHSLKFATNLSTVTLFKKKKFVLPADLNFKGSFMVSGQNTPKVNLFELEFRMFF